MNSYKFKCFNKRKIFLQIILSKSFVFDLLLFFSVATKDFRFSFLNFVDEN